MSAPGDSAGSYDNDEGPFDPAPGIGHNSIAPTKPAEFAASALRAYVERIERMEKEKKAVADDITDVYSEAKATGFDTAVLRAIIRLRKQDAKERAEREALQDLYLHALGMGSHSA